MSDKLYTGGVPKSTPAPGAIVRDWTQEILVNDITNADGETYHFEILPGENPNNIPNVRRATDGNGKTIVSARLPIA